jgi:hypothetical protein
VRVNVGAPAPLVPATHGPHFLKLAWTRIDAKPFVDVSVHTDRELVKPVAKLGHVPELDGFLPLSGVRDLDRSVFFVPDAKVLAVIPPTKDKIVLRRLKLD